MSIEEIAFLASFFTPELLVQQPRGYFGWSCATECRRVMQRVPKILCIDAVRRS